MNISTRIVRPSALLVLAFAGFMATQLHAAPSQAGGTKTSDAAAAPYIEPTAVASGMVPHLKTSKLSKPTRLCGWWDNPTPGNIWLKDRSGQWTIAMQGMYEASGDGPPFTASQLLPKDAPHGHGCACITARVDRASKFVYSFTDAKALEPDVCRSDPALGNSGFNE